jgi:hypothetical protein
VITNTGVAAVPPVVRVLQLEPEVSTTSDAPFQQTGLAAACVPLTEYVEVDRVVTWLTVVPVRYEAELFSFQFTRTHS